MQEIYKRVADLFAKQINALFESEETLKAEFLKNFTHLEFSRTDHWAGIIYKVLRDCWLEAGPDVKAEPTGMDRQEILRRVHPLLDYNLFTQVLLNLQTYTGMAYQTQDAEKDIEALKSEWPPDAKLNPFEVKAKMVKQANTDEEKAHNRILSTLKSLKIISQFTPQISFRVSPKGSTPAFADSRNISMIGIGGDQYLRTLPSLKTFYIHWIPGTAPLMAQSAASSDKGTQFNAPGIPYPFFSKSGGEVLHDVLFARKIMYEVFAAHDTTSEMCTMIPRMNSILIVADQYGHHLKKAFDSLKQRYSMLELAEGSR